MKKNDWTMGNDVLFAILFLVLNSANLISQNTAAEFDVDIFGTGFLNLYEEDGLTKTISIFGIPPSNGGAFQLFDGNGDLGVTLGPAGTSSMTMSIEGDASDSYFDMDKVGDNSVVLPLNSISMEEMINEAGNASDVSASQQDLTGTLTAYASRSIDCPTNGYVLAIASGQLNIVHSSSSFNSESQFGISTNTSSLPPFQDIRTLIPNGADLGTYRYSCAASGIFVVTEGVNNFYFLAKMVVQQSSIADVNLSLMFIPDAGTVTSN